MRRRDFLAGIAGSAAAWPIAAQAQQPPVPVAGFLSPISAAGAKIFLDEYQRGLKETGFIEGQNLKVEYRWAEGHYDRLPALAAELIKLRVAVITTMGDAAYAAKAAQPEGGRDAIPVVFGMGDDPVVTGLVSSLNRPGGHITGGTSFGHGLGPKKLELLRELVPLAKTFGLLVNPTQSGRMEGRDIEQAAGALGIRIRTVNASNPSEIEEAFAIIVRERIDGLIIAVDTFFFSESTRLGSLAARYAVPAIGSLRAFTTAGGLIVFNGDVREIMRQVSIYTGRILKGARPADLPVLLPTKYNLVINLKAAKSLGLTVSLPLLGRADEVIE
ncbi:MAG: ABC transporter substrate-binding protein [Xanthobacteraceae bacterium]